MTMQRLTLGSSRIPYSRDETQHQRRCCTRVLAATTDCCNQTRLHIADTPQRHRRIHAADLVAVQPKTVSSAPLPSPACARRANSGLIREYRRVEFQPARDTSRRG